MKPQNYHFDDHLTWQRKSDLKFLIFNWKIKLGAGRVILLTRACGHSPLPLSPNTSPRISFFFFEKSFTAPPHRSTAPPLLHFSKAPSNPSALLLPAHTQTDPHHTHLFSTFSHQPVQKPQNPSQRETLTRIPLPLPLPLRLTPTLGCNFFCCRCSIPEPLHTPNFIT